MARNMKHSETNGRPVLVVGGSGQIGQQLVRLLHARRRPVVGTYCHNARGGMLALDASDAEQARRVVDEVRPAVVVNAANARGGSDACERDPSLAERYHFGNGRNLADAARRADARFVQISTDYVFDGRDGPYDDEDAAPAPLSRLGQAKLRLESYIAERMQDALIVRTSFVFSWTPRSKTRNFAMQVLLNHKSGEAMRVPVDQVGNVTYAPNFAAGLFELIEMRAQGVYHLAGTTRCSKYAWAMRMVDVFDLDPALIVGVTTEELKQDAPRPLESGFILDKVRETLAHTRLMSLDEGLLDMKRHVNGAMQGLS